MNTRERTAYLERRAAESAAARGGRRASVAPIRRGVFAPVSERCEAVPKENQLRSEAYRRLVAGLACRNCGAPPPCQAAHPNYGKGMAMKTDDRRCFPLCPRCHRTHDQGGHIPRELRREYEQAWERETRAEITAAGTWPERLPMWSEA